MRKHCVFLCILAALLLAHPARAQLGAELGTIPLPANSGNPSVNPTAQRIFFENSSNGQCHLLDMAGNILARGSFPGGSDAYYDASGAGAALTSASRLETLSLAGTITHWRLTIEPVETGTPNLKIENVGSTDINSLIPEGSPTFRDMCANSAGRLLVLGASIHSVSPFFTGIFVAELNTDGTALHRFYPAIQRNQTAFGHMAVNPSNYKRIASDHASGLVAIRAEQSSTVDYIYYLNLETAEYFGRFLWPTADSKLVMEDGMGSIYLFRPATLVRRQLAPAQLPQITTVGSYDPKGVYWDYCDATFGDEFPLVYKVGINWNGTPGELRITAYPPSPTSPEQEVHTYYNTSITPPVLDAGGATVTYELVERVEPMPTHPQVYMTAVNGEGQTSGLVVRDTDIQAYFGRLPGLTCAGISRSKDNDVVKWSAAVQVPSPPITSTITMPSFVPFLGGRKFGINEVFGAFDYAVLSDGQEKGTLTASGAVLVGSGKIGATLAGGVVTDLTPAGVEYPGGYLGLKCFGEVQEETGILVLFPALAAARDAGIPLLSNALQWVDTVVKIVGTFSASISGEATAIRSAQGDLAFAGTNAIEFGVNIASVVSPAAGSLEASVFGEGKTTITADSVPHPTAGTEMTFRDWTLTFTAGYKLLLYGITRSEQRAWIVPILSNASRDTTAKSVSLIDSGWRHAWGRDTNGKSNRARTVPYVVGKNPFADLARSRGKTRRAEAPVIGGLDPDCALFSARAPDGTMMVVWVQDRPDLPATQATDIWYSYFDGETFSAPAPISVDTHGDFHPKVAYHKSGKWLAAWERVADPNLPATEDPVADAQSQLLQMVPSTSIFDPEMGTWTAPFDLRTPRFPTFDIKLATGPGNEITMFWCENESLETELFTWKMAANVSGGGSVGLSTIRLAYARFDGSGFPAPQIFTRSNIRHYDAAMSGNELRVICNGARFFSSALPFQERTELTTWYWNFDEAVTFWRPLDQTQGNQNGYWSLAPRIVALDDGTWRVTWKEYPLRTSGNSNERFDTPTLYITDNLSDLLGSRRVLYADEAPREHDSTFPLSQDHYRFTNSNMEDYELGDAGDGEAWIALRWQTAGKPNLALVLDDGESTVPCKPGLAVDDRALEKRLNVSRDASGDLLLSYFKVDLDRTGIQVEVDDETHDLTMVDQKATGRLAVTRYTVTRNLQAGAVEVIGGLAGEGYKTTLRVPVMNVGERGVDSPTVSVFAREVSAGGHRGAPIVVGENLPASDGVVAGHTDAAAIVEWEAPYDAIWEFYAVADPQNVVDEFDETDNEGPVTASSGGSTDLRGDLVRVLLGSLEPDEEFRAEADINGDGLLDVGDRF